MDDSTSPEQMVIGLAFTRQISDESPEMPSSSSHGVASWTDEYKFVGSIRFQCGAQFRNGS
jgi:hypothetical protein